MASERNKPDRVRMIIRKKIKLRQKLWPELTSPMVWDRQTSDGWLSVPRSMPLLMRIMDSLSKGKPVSSAYLDLWCRTYDDAFVIAGNEREMAFFSGFTGERAVRTWSSRIAILKKLGFIDVKEGPSGPISYILMFNPYHVVHKLYEDNRIDPILYRSLEQRAMEIGAQDLEPSYVSVMPA